MAKKKKKSLLKVLVGATAYAFKDMLMYEPSRKYGRRRKRLWCK